MISIKSMVDKKLKKIDKAIEAIQTGEDYRASPPLAVAAPHNQIPINPMVPVMQVQPPQVERVDVQPIVEAPVGGAAAVTTVVAGPDHHGNTPNDRATSGEELTAEPSAEGNK